MKKIVSIIALMAMSVNLYSAESSKRVFDAKAAQEFMQARMDAIMSDPTTVVLHEGTCIPVSKYNLIMQAKGAKAKLRQLEAMQAKEAALLQEAQEKLARIREEERLAELARVEAERAEAERLEQERKAQEANQKRQASAVQTIENAWYASLERHAAALARAEEQAKAEAEAQVRAEIEAAEKAAREEADRKSAQQKAKRKAKKSRRKARKKQDAADDAFLEEAAAQARAEEVALKEAELARLQAEKEDLEASKATLESEAASLFSTPESNKFYLDILQSLGAILAAESDYAEAVTTIPRDIITLKVACERMQNHSMKDFTAVQAALEGYVNEIIDKNMVDELKAEGLSDKLYSMLDFALSDLICSYAIQDSADGGLGSGAGCDSDHADDEV